MSPPVCTLLLLVIAAEGSISQEIKKGVVVEQTQSNFEGERAGIQKGDVILHWSRGGAQGEIESPFDLVRLEIEQEPQGPVTLAGLRGEERQSWTLGPKSWRIKARPDLPADLVASYLQGEDLVRAGKRTDAIGLWSGLAAQAEKSYPGWLASWIMLHAAESPASPQQSQDTDEAFRSAVQFSAGAGPEVRAQLHRAWALQCEQRGDFQGASRYFQESLETLGSEAQSLAAADNLNSLGRIAGKQGDLARAERYFLQAFTIRNTLAPRSLPLAGTLSNLGLLARRHGDLAKADDSFRQALEIEEKLAPGSLEIALVINNRGLIAEERGDLETARTYYMRVLEIRQELTPGGLETSGVLSNLGNVAEKLGDFENAQRYEKEALETRKRLAPDSADLAESYNALGILALDRGDLVAAEEHHSRALDIRTRKLLPDSMDVAASLFNLGEVALLRGDLAGAEKFHRRALAIKEKQAPGSVNLARSLARIALLAEQRGNLTAAERYLQQSLQINRQQAPGSLAVSQDLNQLAYLAMRRQHPSQAQDYLVEALRIAQGIAPAGLDMAESLHLSGKLAGDRGQLSSAEGNYRQAIEILQRLVPGSIRHAESLAAMAKTLWQENRVADAAQLFAQALDAVESQTAILGGPEDVRFRFRAAYSEYYSAYIDLLMAEQKADLAFAVFERSRARTLMEMLKAASLDIHKGAQLDILERERELREKLAASMAVRIRLLNDNHTARQLAAISQQVERLLAEYKDLQSHMRADSPDFAALTQPQPLSVREVQQQLLDRDTVLLEYALGKSHSYVWVVTGDSLEYSELPARVRIETVARRFYKTVASSDPQQASLGAMAAAALSHMVLSPVAGRISGKRLLIVGDGVLQYIPFSCLPSPGDSQRRTRRSLPLMMEHEIVNLPSASVLGLVRQARATRQPAPKAVAVLADPVFDALDPRVAAAGQTGHVSSTTPVQRVTPPLFHDSLTRSTGELAWAHLARLPFSGREAAAILKVTPPGQGMKALGFEATRSKVTSGELTQYRIVHFATHGLFNTEHPEVSGLVLSLVDVQGQPQNGFLMLQDVYNLNLPAEMVVLSGCETALGKEIRGEGLIGLTRGFMHAGAARVLASLWSVDDAATAELMTEFYRAMEQNSLPAAAALRKAQIKIWRQKRWRLPYYWAGFQLQGEWK